MYSIVYSPKVHCLFSKREQYLSQIDSGTMANQQPKWFDFKTNSYVELTDMHTFHLLNARRKMRNSNAHNAMMWVNLLTKELSTRSSNINHMDAAPNVKVWY